MWLVFVVVFLFVQKSKNKNTKECYINNFFSFYNIDTPHLSFKAYLSQISNAAALKSKWSGHTIMKFSGGENDGPRNT